MDHALTSVVESSFLKEKVASSLKKWKKQVHVARDILKTIKYEIQRTKILQNVVKEDPPIPSCLKIIDFEHWQSFSIVVESINWHGYCNKEN
jgi:hypothetical protein